MELTLVNWIRATVNLGLVVVTLYLIWQVLWFRKTYSAGQMLFISGVTFMLIYVVDAVREAVSIDLEFKWRVIPFVLGTLCLIGYMVEPQARKQKRFGNPDPFMPAKDQ